MNRVSTRRWQDQDTARHLNIEPLFLPTYSPQFNLIGRFWKLVKKNCLNTHYYPTFRDFKKAILHFSLKQLISNRKIN